MLGIRRFRYIGVALALVLTASACGGGEDGTDSPTTTTTTAPSSGGNDGGAADTTTTTVEPASGDSGSTYCDRVREAEASDESPLDFSFFGKSPEELEAQFARNLAIFEEWRDIAPPEIEDDAELVFNFYRTFVERGNELQWDLEAMADDEVFNSGFDDAALDAASVNLENHSRDVCGVDLNSTSDPGPGTGNENDGTLASLLNTLGIPIPLDFLSEDDLECMTTALEPLLTADIGPGYVPTDADLQVIADALEECEIG
jgi:hypothetical protein